MKERQQAFSSASSLLASLSTNALLLLYGSLISYLRCISHLHMRLRVRAKCTKHSGRLTLHRVDPARARWLRFSSRRLSCAHVSSQPIIIRRHARNEDATQTPSPPACCVTAAPTDSLLARVDLLVASESHRFCTRFASNQIAHQAADETRDLFARGRRHACPCMTSTSLLTSLAHMLLRGV